MDLLNSFVTMKSKICLGQDLKIIDNSAKGNLIGKIDSISLVQANNFGTPGLGDLNAILRTGDALKLFWQEDRGETSVAWTSFSSQYR
jgi:hypothetical protein